MIGWDDSKPWFLNKKEKTQNNTCVDENNTDY